MEDTGMKEIEIYKALVQKQDELERLRLSQLTNIAARNYYNTQGVEKQLLSEYFELNNRVKLLIPEIAELRQQLEKAQALVYLIDNSHVFKSQL